MHRLRSAARRGLGLLFEHRSVGRGPIRNVVNPESVKRCLALYNLNHTQWGEEVTIVVSTSIQDVRKICEVGYVAVVAEDLEQQA